MKDVVHTAVVQMETIWLNKKANLGKMLGFIDRVCGESQTDLIVFPELCNTGYVKGRVAEFNVRFFQEAELIPGPFSEALCEAAGRNKVFIAAGMAQQHPQITATLYNSAVLINNQGEIAGIHHKMHIPAEE